MKKAVLITTSIVALIAIIIACVGVYIVNTPEYALKKMIDDVNDSGIDGLYPYLTEDARETVDAVTSIAENDIFSFIMNITGKGNYANVLKSKIQETQWGVKDVLRGKDNATVILSFDYDDKLVGTIKLYMCKEDGSWKIDKLSFPEFDKIDF